MKNIRKGALALIFAAGIIMCSCAPNDNKGGMDQDNSKGEGAIDSTRLTNFDSAGAHADSVK